MPKIILDAGFLRVAIDYLHKRKSGALYYYRRVPQDLVPHYNRKRFIMKFMNDTDPTGNAITRVGRTKRLIREAGRTRLGTRCPTQEEIERTRRVSEAMAKLACLIDGMLNPADQGGLMLSEASP